VRLHLIHRTVFVYDGQARDSFNEARLRPSDDSNQSVQSFVLRSDPASAVQGYVDYFGNHAQRFSIAASHPQLTVEAESLVQTVPNAERPAVPDPAFDAPQSEAEFFDQVEYLQPSRYVPLDDTIESTSRSILPARQGVWADVLKVAAYVHRTLVYRPQATAVDTTASEALRLRAGVCQDFAHVTLGLCRCAGLPVRYVSGYFFNGGRSPDEIEASHAWIEAYVPGFGWAGFDPTHDRLADERYIRVAGGRDYADIRPVSGTYRGPATKELRVEVQVRDASLVRS
jgi:transglutaminase-like putative cysteine protease